MSNQRESGSHTGRRAGLAAGVLALVLAGTMVIPAGAQATGERAKCTSVLTEYKTTKRDFAQDRITSRQASTRLAVLVERINDAKTREAMAAARSTIDDGIPGQIDKLIKRRLNNGHC